MAREHVVVVMGWNEDENMLLRVGLCVIGQDHQTSLTHLDQAGWAKNFAGPLLHR